ncbi:hypothetical protein Tco_1533467 [Tanacetum coccineum]
MSSLTVTYTSVYYDSYPWRFQWVSDDELEVLEEASQFPERAPPSPDYVPGPEHPPSLDYVPSPEHPPSPDYVPALSSGYVADSGPSTEDPEEDPAKYPADRGDDDDDDYYDEEEEAFDEDDEEEEHLALADSTTLPAIDVVPSAEDIEAFKTDESAPIPP